MQKVGLDNWKTKIIINCYEILAIAVSEGIKEVEMYYNQILYNDCL